MGTIDDFKRDIEGVARQVGISEDAIDAILNCKPLPRHKRQEPRVIIGKRISGSDLYAVLNHFDISNDDFREAVITGTLSAYDEVDGKEVKIIHSTYNANWTKNPPGFRYVDLELGNVFDYFYKGKQIKKFLSNIRPSPDAKIEAQKEFIPTKQTTPEQKPATANFFTKEGTIWHIGFEGKETRIKHLAGLQYIGYLLEKPGTPISCRGLYQASGKTPVNVMSEGAAIGEGLNIGSRKQAASDYKAKQNYSEQYQRLANDLENVENNPEGEIVRKEIEKEMEAIIPFLKERTFIDKDTARFQSNVQRRLDNAYAAIHKAGMKEMEKHLKDHIKTDRAYGLTYTGAAAWEITIK